MRTARPSVLVFPPNFPQIISILPFPTRCRHVDSVKFSGAFVVGLCLLSPCVVLLEEEGGADTVKLLLPERSLYCMS